MLLCWLSSNLKTKGAKNTYPYQTKIVFIHLIIIFRCSSIATYRNDMETNNFLDHSC